MKLFSTGLFMLSVRVIALAQLEVPVRVQFTGAAPADRTISGLADPVAADAALSTDAARAGVVTFAQASGSTVLTAVLAPAPAAYSVGMTVTVVPDSANQAQPTLNLNGLGPVPIVKWGGVPLDSADLVPGIPARLVFDGTAFQLLNTAYLPCPDGFFASSRRSCVEEVSHGPLTFFEAAAACSARGARLCGFSEWVFACRHRAGFLSTVPDVEWVDHAANTINGAKFVGSVNTGSTATTEFACEYGFYIEPTVPKRYRCCITR